MGAPKKIDLNAIVAAEGTKAKLSFESVEDPEDKKVRIHKEYASFWIKEMGPILLAGLIAVGLFAFCLTILLRPGSPPGDRDLAWKAMLAIAGAIIGVVFGRATTK